jgi:phage recombination protein Bet
MNDLAVQDKTSVLSVYSKEQLDLIKSQVAKGATDNELKLFLYHAQRTGLDPLSRQIYFQKYKDKSGREQMVIITAIDGYRTIATRTGEHVGTDDPVFDTEDKPNKATVTVYRLVKGLRCPFTATARWNEYYPSGTKAFMWDKMPCGQLGKCAEALALRKAFPNDLSGLYVKEEMDQAHENLIVTPLTPNERVEKYNSVVEASMEQKEDKKEENKSPTVKKGFDPSNETHRKTLVQAMVNRGITDELDQIEVMRQMEGKSFTELDGVIRSMHEYAERK